MGNATVGFDESFIRNCCLANALQILEPINYGNWCGRREPRLIGVTVEEIAMMREMRWWTAEEIEASEERIFPECLAGRMREQRGVRGD